MRATYEPEGSLEEENVPMRTMTPPSQGREKWGDGDGGTPQTEVWPPPTTDMYGFLFLGSIWELGAKSHQNCLKNFKKNLKDPYTVRSG